MLIKTTSLNLLTDQLNTLIALVERQEGAPPFGEIALNAMMQSEPRGVGIAGLEKEKLTAYAFALPNPDGGVWTLEAAVSGSDTPGRYGRFISDVLEILSEQGVQEAVLWVHSPTVKIGIKSLREERRLLKMQVNLPTELKVDLLPGFRFENFRPGCDEEALLEVNNRAFLGHPEQGGWPMAELEKRLAFHWFESEGLVLAWKDDALAGFHWTKRHNYQTAETYVIAVDPAFRGSGLGRVLLAKGLTFMAATGATTAFLYVDAANTAAVSLYQNLGFTTVGTERAYRWSSG